MIDVDLLQSTWRAATEHGDQLAEHFYARLFLAHPELRALFPADMTEQRKKLAQTLTMVVRGARNLEAVAPTLQRLGRDHRGFGARPEHFRHVGTALLETLAHFLDDQWTPEVAATWSEAYEAVWRAMVDAAGAAERAGQPAVWDGTITAVQPSHRDRTVILDINVSDYPVRSGQLVALALPDTPSCRITATPVDVTRAVVVVHLDVDPGDPVALRYAALQAGDHVHLGAPVDPVEPLEQGGPDGRP